MKDELLERRGCLKLLDIVEWMFFESGFFLFVWVLECPCFLPFFLLLSSFLGWVCVSVVRVVCTVLILYSRSVGDGGGDREGDGWIDG